MRGEIYCQASGKVMHASKRQALYVHLRSRPKDRRRRAHIPRHAYRCPDCGAWHATRLAPESRKGRKPER